MKKYRILIPAIALLTAGYVTAQVSFQPGHGSATVKTINLEPNHVNIIDGVAVMDYTNAAANISGSPYLNKEFVDGTMIALDGTVIPGLKYRYDIFGDKMQFILNDDTATINKPLALLSIEMGDQKFVYEVYMFETNSVATGYFELIEETEHLSILYKREIELEQDVYVSNYGGGGGTKDFKMKHVNSYYVKHGKSAAQEIHNKKDLLKIVSDHQHQVKQYMKEKRLSIKKAEDLQAIATYYNSLQDTGS